MSLIENERCLVCDELVVFGNTVRVKGDAMVTLIKAKRRQDAKWMPSSQFRLVVHVNCLEAYVKCNFITNAETGNTLVHTISKTHLPPDRGAHVGMTNNQRHPLLFWPSISDQSEPHCRVSRKDSIRTINAFRGSEENLEDKDFISPKPYAHTENILRNNFIMPEKLFKVIIVGDPTVGKTAFVQRYVSNIFKKEFKGTVGVDFSLKILNYSECLTVKLQLWDIAGQERFTWMTRVYYKDAHSCIIMFDLSNRSSFHNTLKWKQDVDSKCTLPDGSPIPCMLLGNKCDLSSRQIDQMEIETFAKEHNFIGWTEVSAKDGLMVNDSMKFLVDTMLIQEKVELDGMNGNAESLKLTKEQKPKSYCNC